MNRCGCFKFFYTEVPVIDKALIVLRHAATHAIVTHDDVGGAARPEDWAVLAIVGDLPSARRGLDARLVAVGIEERGEDLTRRHEERGSVGADCGVLVQLVRRILRTPHSALRTRPAVSNLVKVVGVGVSGIGNGYGVREFALGIVGVIERIGLRKRRARMRSRDSATSGVVSVIVLRNDVGRRCVANLKQLPLGVIGPRGGEAIGIGERGFGVAARGTAKGLTPMVE